MSRCPACGQDHEALGQRLNLPRESRMVGALHTIALKLPDSTLDAVALQPWCGKLAETALRLLSSPDSLHQKFLTLRQTLSFVACAAWIAGRAETEAALTAKQQAQVERFFLRFAQRGEVN